MSPLDEQELAALRAQVRCGRSDVPALHLLEADEQLLREWWRYRPARVALCCAELDESTPLPDPEACPGCADCLRYCTDCLRVATAWSAADSPGGAS